MLSNQSNKHTMIWERIMTIWFLIMTSRISSYPAKIRFQWKTALDMGNHTIFNVKDPTVDDQGVNKGYVDKKFLPRSGGTMKNELSMGGNKITNIARPMRDADAATKKFVVDKTGKCLLLAGGTMTGPINMGGNKVANAATPTNPTDAATKFFVEKETQKCLSLGGGTMTGQIDMDGNKITNLETPTSNSDAATKKYLDDEVKKTKDGIIDSHSLKDEFRYLMEDVNESSSESNIEVDGISDLEKSPHKHNKKAYDLKLKKTSGENYASRLGFNMYKLPEGEYTICVEFFPVKMTNVSVNAVSSSLNIGQQTTTLFTQEGYARSIIHMHKWQISPPEYLMLDLHCEGETPIGQAYLIIYGIKGKYSDVPAKVFDQPFVFETGKMVMETDLDLNGKRLLNYPKSKAVILGQYQKATESEREKFTINNESAHHVFGFDFTVKKITIHFTIRDGPIVPVNTSVIIKASSKTQSASGVFIGNNAISYSFDFAVAAIDEFELSLRNRGGIARANATILIEI